MEKFDGIKHRNLAENLPFSYASARPYLDFACYVLARNNRKEIVVQDLVYPNSFPYLYVPDEDNWENSQIVYATEAELRRLKDSVEIVKEIPIGGEFIYRTEDFINMPGKKWAKFRQHVRKFPRVYKHKLVADYPMEKVGKFSEKWLASQKLKTASFKHSFDFFNFCLNNADKYKIKIIFAEIENELAGVAMGVDFDSDRWIGLHLKVDYKFKGLSRFLHHERAKLFQGKSFLTLGQGGDDPGIERFKQELNPIDLVKQYYVITGDKLSGGERK